MKRLQLILPLLLGSTLLLSGCVAAIGNREGKPSQGTLGQELIDLQKAKDAGVISDAEFQTQRTRLLGHK